MILVGVQSIILTKGLAGVNEKSPRRNKKGYKQYSKETKMASELQKKAFEIRAKKIKEKKPVVMKEVLLEAGASTSTARVPKLITDSKGWQELLAKYDDEPIVDLIYEEGLSKTDKRNATENRKILLTLKDRFPKQDTKVLSLFTAVQKYGEDEKD